MSEQWRCLLGERRGRGRQGDLFGELEEGSRGKEGSRREEGSRGEEGSSGWGSGFQYWSSSSSTVRGADGGVETTKTVRWDLAARSYL